mmetsp:Transcript_24663/g.41360  ORF Transcript_24663/g.41360 Transcript_24663/m.41360 type:complete len:345 (+) Transcript_24663:655-1689(+)
MVAKDGDLTVGTVVEEELLFDGLEVGRHLLELLLKSDTGVEGTEDLGGEASHLGLEVSVEHGRSELVKQIVRRLLALDEGLEVLVDRLDHLDLLLKQHTVLTKERQLHDKVIHQGDVLDTQRAAAHSVSLVLALFVSDTESEVVDEPKRCGPLALKGVSWRSKLGHVSASDVADVARELACLLELLEVRLALETAGRREPDVLEMVVDVLLPEGEPGDFIVVDDGAPFFRVAFVIDHGTVAAWVDAGRDELARDRDLDALGDVESDIRGLDAGLEHACLWVLSTTQEETRRFDLKVADAFLPVVDVDPAKGLCDLEVESLFQVLLFLAASLLDLLLSQQVRPDH